MIHIASFPLKNVINATRNFIRNALKNQRKNILPKIQEQRQVDQYSEIA